MKSKKAYLIKANGPKFSQNILIIFTSLLIFFFLGEVVVRIIFGTPLIVESDELLFWKYKKGQSGHHKLYEPYATVDKNGFRFSGKQFNPNISSIYVGGDSYAWGIGVHDTETFPGQLQKLLDTHRLEYNVLNGGVPGYGIEQIINRMKIECTKYYPKYAFFMWAETDINRLRDLTPEQKRKFLRDHRLRSVFRYSAFMKIIKEQVFEKLLRTDVGFGYHRDRTLEYAESYTFEEKMVGLTPQIIDSISFLRELGIIPIWVITTVPTVEFRNYLGNLAREYDVLLIDPVPVYNVYFPNFQDMATEESGHFKPKVYELIANEVFQKIFLNKQSETTSLPNLRKTL